MNNNTNSTTGNVYAFLSSSFHDSLVGREEEWDVDQSDSASVVSLPANFLIHLVKPSQTWLHFTLIPYAVL